MCICFKNSPAQVHVSDLFDDNWSWKKKKKQLLSWGLQLIEGIRGSFSYLVTLYSDCLCKFKHWFVDFKFSLFNLFSLNACRPLPLMSEF